MFILAISVFNSSGDKPSNFVSTPSFVSSSVISKFTKGGCMSFNKLVISSTSTSFGLCTFSVSNLASKSSLSPDSSSSVEDISSMLSLVLNGSMLLVKSFTGRIPTSSGLMSGFARRYA